MQQGIVYRKTGSRSRGVVHHYHGKPSPLRLSTTDFRADVSGLKPVQQRNAILFNGYAYSSKFTIGMEVEKNELSRGAVKEYELFCGFERDGSCGYEAVTHILPLLPAGSWRTKVFDMMHKAEKIIDDNYSPSDKRCGGHITIGVEGMDGNELNEAVRKHAGIILALFRHRLNTKYCGANRRMQAHMYNGVYNSWGGCYEYGAREWHRKYQTALVKGDVLEFRLPSRFESVKQMMRRYELFYEVVDFSVNNPNGSHLSLMNRLRPIVLSMYNGDADKADKVIGYAKHFRKFILDGTIHQDIAKYLQ
jgi:hypothetical protein